MTISDLKTNMLAKLYFGVGDQSAAKVMCDSIATKINLLADTTIYDDINVSDSEDNMNNFIDGKITLANRDQRLLVAKIIRELKA